MEIYLVISIVTLILSIHRQSAKVTCIFLSFIFFIVAAFRDSSVGTDTLAYINTIKESGLQEFSFSGQNQGLEIIWTIFYRMIIELNLEHYFIIIFSSFLTILFLFLAIKQLSYNAAFSLFFYFVLFFSISLNAARQMLAVSILFYGYTYLLNSQNKKFVLLVIIASLIHFSSIVYLLCIPFLSIRLSQKIGLILMIISLLMFLLGLNNLSNLSFLFPSFAYYFDLLYPDSGKLSIFGKLYIICCNLLYILSYLIQRNKNWRLNQLFILFVVLSNLLAGYHIYISRIIYGIAIIQIIYFVNIFYTASNMRLRYLMIFLAVILSYYSFLQGLSRNFNEIVPYSFRSL